MDNKAYRLRFTPTELRPKTDVRQILRERRSKGDSMRGQKWREDRWRGGTEVDEGNGTGRRTDSGWNGGRKMTVFSFYPCEGMRRVRLVEETCCTEKEGNADQSGEEVRSALSRSEYATSGLRSTHHFNHGLTRTGGIV